MLKSILVYKIKGYNNSKEDNSLSVQTYTGYIADAPNVYFPTKTEASDETGQYWIASPSSNDSNSLMTVVCLRKHTI